MTAGIGPLPWQESVWSRLMASLARDRLAHGLLVTGPVGVGKRLLAEGLAQAILCQERSESGRACGGCRACRLIAGSMHPDLSVVQPEDSRVIGIDQVRALHDRLVLTSHAGGAKVAIVDLADRLTAEAANALLKTLEEPPAGSQLIVCTARPGLLPATVLSRCQRVVIQLPTPELGRAWLAERLAAPEHAEIALARAQGAPLRALREAAEAEGRDAMGDAEHLCRALQEVAGGVTDPVALAAHWHERLAGPWQELGLERLLERLVTLLLDAARLKLADQPPRLVHPDLAAGLRRLAGPIHLRPLLRCVATLEFARARARHPLNRQLVLEDVLLAFHDAARAARPPGPSPAGSGVPPRGWHDTYR